MEIFPNSEDFYAQAYKNEELHEIIIAFRGTRPTSWRDLWNDLQLTAHASTMSQELAAEYASRVADANDGWKIINTGHSLGGNLAQAATAHLQDIGVSDVSAFLLDAPGIGGYTHTLSSDAYSVINVVSKSDLIHLVGGDHLGKQINTKAGPEMVGPMHHSR